MGISTDASSNIESDERLKTISVVHQFYGKQIGLNRAASTLADHFNIQFLSSKHDKPFNHFQTEPDEENLKHCLELMDQDSYSLTSRNK